MPRRTHKNFWVRAREKQARDWFRSRSSREGPPPLMETLESRVLMSADLSFGPLPLNADSNAPLVAGVTSGGSRFDATTGDRPLDTRVDAYQNSIDSIVSTTAPDPNQEDLVVVDNQDAGAFSVTGQWRESGSIDEFQGSSLFNLNVGATATWTPTLEAGTYEVAVRWGAEREDGTFFPRDPNAQYTIEHDGVTDTFSVDQNTFSGQWIVLDTLTFDGSGQESVTLTASTDGSSPANADAVRFTLIDDQPDEALVAYWNFNEGSGSTAEDNAPRWTVHGHRDACQRCPVQ